MNPNEQTNTANNGQKKVGPIVAVLVIVLVLIVVALYLFASRINNQAQNDTSLTGNEAAVMIPVETVTNTSDEIDSLQADLELSTSGLDTQNF